MTQGSERREYERINVDLRVVERSGNATYFQYATSLSEGGVFLEGTLAHVIGTEVTLVFRVPERAEVISIPARVVGPGPGLHGMRMKFLDDADDSWKPALRQLLDRANKAKEAGGQ